MSTIDELLAANTAYADAYTQAELNGVPRRHVALVTCMDCRLDLHAALGLSDGDAHVLRNGGGVVSDDVIRSLAISQRKLGTRDVMLVHHTDCGMTTMSDDGFRAELLAETGTAPPFAIESFTDAAQDVRQSILRVRRSPFILHRDAVRGFIYDVSTRRLQEVSVDGR